MLDTVTTISTKIPKSGPCYVQVNDTQLDCSDAMQLGTLITSAARRCEVLNQVMVYLVEAGTDVEIMNVMLVDILRRLSNLT